MTDTLNEALAQMDRELGIEPEPQTGEPAQGAPDPGGTPAEQTRDEQGRFAKEPEPDPVPEPEPSDPEDTGDPKFAGYLARFGTTPDTLTDLPAEVQKAIRAGFEADQLVGRRGQEYGELKKELEQLRDQLAPEPEQPRQYDGDQLSDWFADNPAQIIPAIENAYRQGDRTLLWHAVAALNEVDAPRAESIRAEIAKQDALAEMRELTQPLQEQGRQTTFATAWGNVAREHPGLLDDLTPDAIIAVAQTAPEVLAEIQSGTVDSLQRVIVNLAKIAAYDHGRQANQLVGDAAREAAERQATEAAAAKKEAFVGSGSQRNDPEPIDENEQWLREHFDPAAARYMAHD